MIVVVVVVVVCEDKMVICFVLFCCLGTRSNGVQAGLELSV